MRKVRIALPDGDGVYGNREFWKEFFDLINVEYVDCDDNLKEYIKMSNEVFPAAICLNSKYRLGKSLKLAKDVDYFMFFLREDIVANCLASIYRVEWIKDYFAPDIKTITWKKDLCPGQSDSDNFARLSEILVGDPNIEIANKLVIPKRQPVYEFSLRKIDKKKKTVMIIGVAPFLVDLYRKSKLMDYISSKVNMLNPISLATKDLDEESNKLYREKTIMASIDKAIKHNLVDGYMFVGDAFDLPGKYSFPRIKKHIKENTDKKIFDVIVGISNVEIVKEKFDEFIASI